MLIDKLLTSRFDGPPSQLIYRDGTDPHLKKKQLSPKICPG